MLEHRYPDLYSLARSFISPASFKIFNRLCDTLILLALAYARYYPDEAFCPWLLGTDFLEHFFGLARRMLPNFTYAELLKLVKHVMLRQKILLTRKTSKQTGCSQAGIDRGGCSGYIFDFDNSPLSAEELKNSRSHLSKTELNLLVELAEKEASKIARQLLHIKIVSPSKRAWVLAPISTETAAAHRKRKNMQVLDDDSDTDWESDLEEDLHDDSDSEGDDSDQIAAEDSDLGSKVKDAAKHCARYTALSEDYDTSLEEWSKLGAAGSESTTSQAAGPAQSKPQPAAPSSRVAQAATNEYRPHDGSTGTPTVPVTSAILDSNGKVSVKVMLRMRQLHQSGTAVKSERIVALDPKFSLSRFDGLMTGKAVTRRAREVGKKMSIKEASHRVRITQVLHGGTAREKKVREHRYVTQSQSIQKIARRKRNGV